MTVENAEERRRLLQERRQFALEYSKERKRPYDKVKRVCDIIGSFVLLIFFVIVLPIFALCIKLDSRGPVFFVQERVGKDMRLFRMYKFRTMVYDAEQRAAEVKQSKDCKNEFIQHENDPRVTRVGAVLRRFSLDELPQLFNIIKGEMSLVGPRPFIIEETLMCRSEHLRRHTVRPGMSGYAQVNGRNDLTLEERMEKDLYYVDHMGFWMDVGIMIKTFFAIFSKKGAY
ncbi:MULTISPECIES: sugar transferase [unclassified Clostridium]|uniref:sugar transferase n=1 Tax=unclassified Clostridium TaxID=2614128 RepID=UPI001485484F|nr:MULTISPECIES: sugar transferase [unclassified Clostridium]